jgi:sirohydrochlorin ferrochelatase
MCLDFHFMITALRPMGKNSGLRSRNSDGLQFPGACHETSDRTFAGWHSSGVDLPLKAHGDTMTDTPASAILVAHGSPSEPGPQDVALKALAEAVGALLPGWTIRGETLAAEGSLEGALDGLPAPLIYPFFMAEGFFTGRALPGRLGKVGAIDARQLAPFGTDPALPALMAQAALEGARSAALDPSEGALLLAAHGSQVSSTSKDSTYAMAGHLRALTPFARIEVGLIEEPPHLADVARALGGGVCLPFFALRAGHVEGDVPQALAEAGFGGPLLPAIGEHPGVPRLIADALLRAVT